SLLSASVSLRPSQSRTSTLFPYTTLFRSLCIVDLNEPLGLHGVEILTDIGWQVASRIQHERLAPHALEYNPVPEVMVFFLMVLDRQQCQIRQCLPRFKWGFVSGSFDTCALQHTLDILRICPQRVVGSMDTHSIGFSVHLCERLTQNVAN